MFEMNCEDCQGQEAFYQLFESRSKQSPIVEDSVNLCSMEVLKLSRKKCSRLRVESYQSSCLRE